MSERNEITLEALLGKAVRAQVASMETGLSAVVLDYDAVTQTARVQPTPKRYFKDGSSENLPSLAGVPVMFPSGAGFAITWPLKKGDPVWLAFSGRPFDAWLTTGDAEADEPTRRRFSMTDCVAFAQGPTPSTKPLQSTEPDKMVFGEDGPGGATIRIGGGKVELGTAGIGLLDLLEQLISALQTGVVATVLGPQPLDPATQLLLTNIKTQLGLIKGD